MSESAPFQPTEVWQMYEPASEAVAQVTKEMNREDPVALVASLRNNVIDEPNGAAIAIMSGYGYSETDAIVMFTPVAHGVSPNMLIKAEFLRRVARQQGIVDDQGKYKPVILLTTPDIVKGSNLFLTQAEERTIRLGDQGPFIRPMMDAVTWEGFGRVALVGFSQGGAVVLRAGLEENAPNLDITGIATAAGPNHQGRLIEELGIDFTKTGAEPFARAVRESGLVAQHFTINRRDGLRMLLSFPMSTNRSLIKSLCVDNHVPVVEQLFSEGRVRKLYNAYGDQDLMTRPEYVEPNLARLHRVDKDHVMTSIRVEGANHAWGDYLPLLAKLYMLAAS